MDVSARVLRIAISLLFGISCGGTNARFTAPISDASPDSVLASDGSVEDAASSDGAAKPADAFADSGVLVAADADASTGCSYSWRDGGPDATQSDNASVFLVATNPTTPAYLAVDDTTVYWTDSWDRVMKAPLTGREAFVVAGTGTPSPAAIAVDATYVYWASTGGQRILRCPKDDCNCTPFVVAAPLGDITEIALGAGEVYTSDPNGGRILACATSGCRNHPRVVYSGSAPSQLAVHDGNIYFFDAPQMPGQPVQAPRILKCPVNGCGNAPTVLASVGARTALAVDSNNVYWVAVPPPGGRLVRDEMCRWRMRRHARRRTAGRRRRHLTTEDRHGWRSRLLQRERPSPRVPRGRLRGRPDRDIRRPSVPRSDRGRRHESRRH